jgi:hypothetical protein
MRERERERERQKEKGEREAWSILFSDNLDNLDAHEYAYWYGDQQKVFLLYSYTEKHFAGHRTTAHIIALISKISKRRTIYLYFSSLSQFIMYHFVCIVIWCFVAHINAHWYGDQLTVFLLGLYTEKHFAGHRIVRRNNAYIYIYIYISITSLGTAVRVIDRRDGECDQQAW